VVAAEKFLTPKLRMCFLFVPCGLRGPAPSNLMQQQQQQQQQQQ